MSSIKKKAISILDDLSNDNDQKVRYNAVRKLKNSIIGSHTRKSLFVENNAIPKLAELLHDDECSSIRQQAAIALGSLGIEEADQIIVESFARTLKILVSCENVDANRVFMYINSRSEILTRLLEADLPLSQHAAILLSKYCNTEHGQNDMADSTKCKALIGILRKSQDPKSIEALCQSLKDIIWCSDTVSFIINTEQGRSLCKNLCDLLQRGETSGLRISAAEVLTKLHRSISEPLSRDFINYTSTPEEILAILTTLTKDPDWMIQARSVKCLACLIERSETLQARASHDSLLDKLASYFDLCIENPCDSSSSITYDHTAQPNTNTATRLKEGALLAFAAMSSKREASRAMLIKRGKVLDHIMSCLQDPNVEIRIAGGQCTRSLSRSVAHLRTTLVDIGLSDHLFRMLDDKSIDVQVVASATLCNLVLEFSPVKKSVLEKGGMERLVRLTHSKNRFLRTNGVWAIKNLLYQVELPNVLTCKKDVMKILSWEHLFKLSEDVVVDVEIQALGVLRNLSFGSAACIDEIIRAFGDSASVFFDYLLSKLTEAKDDRIVHETLYIICNIAESSEEYKDAISNHTPLLICLGDFVGHSHSDIVVAAIWTIINLCSTGIPNFPLDAPAGGVNDRISIVKSAGIDKKLNEVANHKNIDVQDRAKNALALLDTEDISMQEED
eukprot:UC4_evm5s507